MPLGLLHMRPLQHWLHGRVQRWAWQRGTHRVTITPACRQAFSPWSDPAFLRAGVPIVQVSRHAVVCTDASTTGWGATYNRQAALGLWTGMPPSALAHQLPRVAYSTPCAGPLQNASTRQARTGPYRQHCDRCVRQPPGVVIRSRLMSQLARHLHLRSLRAIYISGLLNRAADELSQQHALPGEWRLHPRAIQLIWRHFGAAQVDLFASPDTSHCQWFYSLTGGTLGTDALAHSWLQGLHKYAFPPVSLLAQTLCKVREDKEQVLLVAPSCSPENPVASLHIIDV